MAKEKIDNKKTAPKEKPEVAEKQEAKEKSALPGLTEKKEGGKVTKHKDKPCEYQLYNREF